MPRMTGLEADTLMLAGIIVFIAYFPGLACLRLFVPEDHWINRALHRVEGHLELNGSSRSHDVPDLAESAADGEDGD